MSSGADFATFRTHHRPSDGRVRDYLGQKSWTPRSNNNNHGFSEFRPNVNNRRADDYMANNAPSTNNNTAATRRTRYSRSSTASVAQLLSDSCTSLLQKLTTRVRGPSASTESASSHNESKNTSYNNNPFFGGHPLATSKSTTVVPNFGHTRSRLEDKYSSVLDRIYNSKKRYSEKPDSGPVSGRTLSKSSTTTNVLLTEKAYPYVSKVQREKTPYRGESRNAHYNNLWRQQQYPEPQYLDRDSAYRVRHRSNHSELRPRKSSKPHSETTNLKLLPVEKPVVPVHAKAAKVEGGNTNGQVPRDGCSSGLLSEREAKRKEIQSLIKKYSALDDFYNRLETRQPTVDAAAVQKKQSLGPVSTNVGSNTSKYYHHKLSTSVVSSVVVRVYLLVPPSGSRH